jgi:hypothetical protein
VRLFHWNAAEAAPLISDLRAAGHSIEYDEDFRAYWRARDSPPDAFVVDLSRRPSHGREVAIVLRGSKTTRHIPILFVDGEPGKVQEVRRTLPDAVYTSRAHLAAAIRRAKPIASPVAPTQMMDRYAGRTAAQKLGITKGIALAVVDPPADYVKAIGKLPEGAWFEEDDRVDCKITLWFLHDFGVFEAALPKMRRVAERSKLWILWRKGKQDGIDGNIVRRGANEFGLVDYKICAVNPTWSGMAFALKKATKKRG